MDIKAYILSFLFIMNMSVLFAQEPEEIHLKNINGKAYSDCISTSEAMAIQKAKQKALNKSGIVEDVQLQNTLEKAEINGNYSELFSSNVFTQIQGGISKVEITDISRSISNELVETEVVINCTVLKYKTKSDPHFQAKVDGVQPFYTTGKTLNFNLIPTRNCYLRAWLFTENDAFTLFPNALEKAYELQAKDTATFPSYQAVYRLENDSGESEINRLIMVIMKEDFQYMGKDTYKDISEWIVSLPPDKRIVKHFSIIVNDK